jgi:hypothetical protein
LLFPDLPAHADSKAAAEFTLKTCSDAMEDFAKVAAAARDGNWTVPQLVSQAMSKYMRNRSMWTVPQGDETYTVLISESVIGEEQKQPPRKLCSIFFPNKTVQRDEFFNQVASAMDLTFAVDTRTPQMQTETYEINRYRPNKVNFTFMSTLDGIVSIATMQEAPTFDAPRARPAAPTGVDR